MTRKILESVARQMRIDLKQYDFVNAEYVGSNYAYIEVTFWKDQGVGSDRTKHDIQRKKFQHRALLKEWENGGADPDDYLTGGARRIFNIK